MLNSYRNGSDAQTYSDKLETAIDNVIAAAVESSDAVEYLEAEVDNRDTVITDLETQLEELEDVQAHKLALRAYALIRKFAQKNIDELERTYGKIEAEETSEHSSAKSP